VRQCNSLTELEERETERESTNIMSALRFLRKRPVTSASALGGLGIASAACFLEYTAEGQLPRVYDWDSIHSYWSHRPVTTLLRFVHVFTELAPLAGGYVKDFVLTKPEPTQAAHLELVYASRLREALTNLGPAFVKAGQQLSIRPDLVPPSMLKELQKLCDSVRPISDEVAMQVIRDDLKQDPDKVFVGMKRVASASLGQVYKAKLASSGETVAIKVQRPDMRSVFSLDLFLLQSFSLWVDAFTATFTNQPAFHKKLYESFARGSYSELDYDNEASNQILFRNEFAMRGIPVIVPLVYLDYTSEKVLTSEWIDGTNLSDAPKELINKLIPLGVELFICQLLDIGKFHSDPHGGNLLVTGMSWSRCHVLSRLSLSTYSYPYFQTQQNLVSYAYSTLVFVPMLTKRSALP
jgi:aarF domain-containing kinase